MPAFTPYGRVKEIFEQIRKMEDRLETATVLPMTEQKAIHAEIAKFKVELVRLEKIQK